MTRNSTTCHYSHYDNNDYCNRDERVICCSVVVVVVIITIRASDCAGCAPRVCAARACVFVGVCSARVTVDAPLPWSISAENCAKR